MRTRDLPWVKDLLKGQPKYVKDYLLIKLSAARRNKWVYLNNRYDFCYPRNGLLTAFPFHRTPEGYGFWMKIAHKDFSVIEKPIKESPSSPVESGWSDSPLHRHVIATYGGHSDEILHNLLLNGARVHWQAEALERCFVWADSIQGLAYWGYIHREDEPPPDMLGYDLRDTVLYQDATKSVDCPIVKLQIRIELDVVRQHLNGIKKAFFAAEELYSAFLWDYTPQGKDFWCTINNGNCLSL